MVGFAFRARQGSDPPVPKPKRSGQICCRQGRVGVPGVLGIGICAVVLANKVTSLEQYAKTPRPGRRGSVESTATDSCVTRPVCCRHR